MPSGKDLGISVIVPVFNERENVSILADRLVQVLAGIGDNWEIIFVDDGSTDGTLDVLASLATSDSRLKIIQFRRNFGQTAALWAGILASTKGYLVTLDGDLQNDPADIPKLINKLDDGYDIVHGWRKERNDPFLSRRLPSLIANWLIRKICGETVHDLGCSLRAMRREIALELELYGEMHRFLPILAHWRGAKAAEVVVRHFPRRFGRSKYGLDRTIRVLLDLLTVKFILDYFPSPMKLFGLAGLACAAVGIGAAITSVGMKLFGGMDMTGTPFLLIAVFSVMVGMQLLSLGLLGEVCVRIYYAGQGRQSFAIRTRVNFQDAASTNLGEAFSSEKPARETPRIRSVSAERTSHDEPPLSSDTEGDSLFPGTPPIWIALSESESAGERQAA